MSSYDRLVVIGISSLLIVVVNVGGAVAQAA